VHNVSVGADHVHLWTSFELAPTGPQPVRSCIVCGDLQTWDESFGAQEAGMWWNYATEQLDETPFGSSYRRALERQGWNCETVGHLSTFGSAQCVVCGEAVRPRPVTS
jgi:hypothetical protein